MLNTHDMRDSQSPEHRSYTGTPHYPPMRRSGRQQYVSATVGMSHPPQYHTTSTALPANYALDLASYAHQPAHPITSGHTSQSPQTNSGSGYLDSFPGMPLPDVMDMAMDPSPMGIDLSILSADEHRDLRMLESRPREAVRQEPSQEGGSGERRRRQRRAQSDDSIDTPPLNRTTGKKQRGRPRLDPTDENAADRRRTQIRLAQRAYRLRKETTISSLRNRVTELENAIENMQSTFLELHEFAMECAQKNDQREVYAETIRNLGERFLAQSKGALGAEHVESLGDDDTTDDRSHVDRNERPRSRDDGGPTSGGTGSMGGLPPWGGYQISYTRGASHEDTYNSGTTESKSRSGYEGIPQDQNSLNTYMDDQSLSFYPSPPTIPSELAGPFSYSFHETSFSRRLHRAALEGALRLLTSPTANQNDVARTFAYTFCYASRQDVINGVTRLLRAGSNESLSPCDYPGIIHQQFPTRPLDNYDDILQAYQDKARKDVLGASNPLLREEAHKQLIKLGINNKFLAPVDVENVLVENGILESIEAPRSDRGSSPASSQDLDYLTPSSIGSVDSQTSSDTLFPAPSKNETSYPASKKGLIIQGVKKTVDLDVLVKELVSRGVCLGQFPGFKRSDVDDCIRIASTPVQMVF